MAAAGTGGNGKAAIGKTTISIGADGAATHDTVVPVEGYSSTGGKAGTTYGNLVTDCSSSRCGSYLGQDSEGDTGRIAGGISSSYRVAPPVAVRNGKSCTDVTVGVTGSGSSICTVKINGDARAGIKAVAGDSDLVTDIG